MEDIDAIISANADASRVTLDKIKMIFQGECRALDRIERAVWTASERQARLNFMKELAE